jgi:hypothetical protein
LSIGELRRVEPLAVDVPPPRNSVGLILSMRT